MKQSNIPVPPVCIGCRDCTVPAAVPGTRSPAASFSVTGYRHGPRLQDAVVEELTLAVVGNPSPPSQARPGCTRLGLATAGVRPFGPATAVGEGDPVEHGLSLAVQRNFIALEQPFTVLTAGIEGHGGAFDKGVPIPCLVAGPAQLGPDAHGTPRPRGRRRIVCYYIASLPVDAEDLPGWSARPPGCGEQPVPHLGRAVPGG